MKRLLTLLFLSLTTLMVAQEMDQAQLVDSLKSLKAEKEAAVKELQGEISSIKGQIDALPGWEVGSFGTLGFNLSNFNNWQKGANPNAVSSAIRASVNAYANYDQPKLFWRNSGGINLGWLKLDTDVDDNEDAEFEQVADVLKLTSLFGYKLTDKLAMSSLAEYNTSILSNFNDPGILDFGLGFTWTPVQSMVVVVHPVNYHWVFGDNPEFDNGLGAKIVADYTRELVPGLTWKTNLTTFLAYKSTDPSLSEWTWTNSFGFNVWKGIGVGLEFGLRNAEVESPEGQSYWVLGISYGF